MDEHEETIADMTINDDKTMLLSASSDGHMGVFDLRNTKEPLYAMSDNFEEDLSCI